MQASEANSSKKKVLQSFTVSKKCLQSTLSYRGETKTFHVISVLLSCL